MRDRGLSCVWILAVSLTLSWACVPWESASTLPRARGDVVSRLISNQHKDGYWIPVQSRTPDPVRARPEAEVTTTGMVLLLLQHLVLDDHRIAEAVRRGESFLSDQIEPDGLVRFYGNRNVLRFGSRLPPDLGDTALVWLVAPPNADRNRLDGVLAALTSVTDPQTGVPATWLIGAGDPRWYGLPRNPVDAQVVAETWMMLQHRDPKRADPRLCAFLKNKGQTLQYQVWFYHAPPVQRLTWDALARTGCVAPAPKALRARLQPGQELWDELVGLLLQLEAAEPGDVSVSAARQRLRKLLLELAADDLEMVRNQPPLIYNKETVPEGPVGFYWSEDWGLALWLRAEYALRVQGGRS